MGTSIQVLISAVEASLGVNSIRLLDLTRDGMQDTRKQQRLKEVLWPRPPPRAAATPGPAPASLRVEKLFSECSLLRENQGESNLVGEENALCVCFPILLAMGVLPTAN